MAKKISEEDRTEMALKLIDEITANEQGTEDTPTNRAFGNIYRLAHSVLSPECRKNHPEWVRVIDKAIRAEAKNP